MQEDDRQVASLVDRLAKELRDFQYAPAPMPLPAAPDLRALLVTPRRLGVRLACTVLHLPPTGTLRSITTATRKALVRKYARFPWYKELGTFHVVLCRRDVFDAAASQAARVPHRTGLHTNVSLGLVLVEQDGTRIKAAKAWGLIGAGKHYEAIRNAVQTWRSDS